MEKQENLQLRENKTLRASVRFETQDGQLTQRTVIYDDKAKAETRVHPVYCTRHGRVSVTRTSILISLKFKKEQPTLDMINAAFDEINQIEDWLHTDACKDCIEKAEAMIE